jgi:high-affinity Fe2+/Pb2+ permease
MGNFITFLIVFVCFVLILGAAHTIVENKNKMNEEDNNKEDKDANEL